MVDKDIASWLLELLSVENIVKELVFNNPMILMRKLIVGMVKVSLITVNDDTKRDFFLRMIQYLPLAAKGITKYYAQYLEIIREIAFASPIVLAEYDIMTALVLHLFRQKINGLPDAPALKFTDIYLGYENSDGLEDFNKDENYFEDPKGVSTSGLIQILAENYSYINTELVENLKRPDLMVFLLKEVDSKISAKSLGCFYAQVCRNDLTSSQTFLDNLENFYQHSDYTNQHKYIYVFSPVLLYSDGLQQFRIEHFTSYLFKHITNSKYSNQIERAINYIFKLATKSDLFREFIRSQTSELLYLNTWISNNSRVSYKSQNEEFDKPSYKVFLQKLQKLALGEKPNLENEWDSDEEIDFAGLKEIDILESSGFSYLKVKLEACLGEIIVLSHKTSSGQQLVWREKNNDDLAPPDSRSENSYK